MVLPSFIWKRDNEQRKPYNAFALRISIDKEIAESIRQFET